jgi:hypothetical protein
MNLSDRMGERIELSSAIRQGNQYTSACMIRRAERATDPGYDRTVNFLSGRPINLLTSRVDKTQVSRVLKPEGSVGGVVDMGIYSWHLNCLEVVV